MWASTTRIHRCVCGGGGGFSLASNSARKENTNCNIKTGSLNQIQHKTCNSIQTPNNVVYATWTPLPLCSQRICGVADINKLTLIERRTRTLKKLQRPARVRSSRVQTQQNAERGAQIALRVVVLRPLAAKLIDTSRRNFNHTRARQISQTHKQHASLVARRGDDDDTAAA